MKCILHLLYPSQQKVRISLYEHIIFDEDPFPPLDGESPGGRTYIFIAWYNLIKSWKYFRKEGSKEGREKEIYLNCFDADMLHLFFSAGTPNHCMWKLSRFLPYRVPLTGSWARTLMCNSNSLTYALYLCSTNLKKYRACESAHFNHSILSLL